MIWKEYNLSKSQSVAIKCGSTKIQIGLKSEGIIIKEDLLEEPEFDVLESAEFDSYDGVTTISATNPSGIRLMPSLPDKPLILKTVPSFKVMPKEKMELFIFIPVVIQLFDKNQRESELLFEKQSVELSQAWLGESDSGMLAYSLHKAVDFTVRTEVNKNWTVTCKATFRNDWKKTVEPNRLSFDPRRLRIYVDNNGNLYSNDITFHHRDENSAVEIEYSSHPPSIAPNAKVITEARNPEDSNIFAKGYNFLKAITQYR